MSDSLIAFSPAQLAIIVVVLAAALVWAVKFGFTRLIASMDEKFQKIDERFDKLDDTIDGIREGHPTRPEVHAALEGVHRRIDDFHKRRQSSGNHRGVAVNE